MKSRSNYIFTIFCLGLLVVLVEMNSYFKNYFSDGHAYLQLSEKLKVENERERLKTALAKSQLKDLEQDVAKLLPTEQLHAYRKDEYRLKQMTSSLRVPASEEGVDLSSVLMEKGKSLLKKNDYEKATRVFQELLVKFPTSSQVVEAHFLLGESYFQLEKYDECLDVAYDMMNHYPQNEMTGYLMLRNAQILAQKRRNVEAGELYRVIIRQFQTSEMLKQQAQKMLQGVES